MRAKLGPGESVRRGIAAVCIETLFDEGSFVFAKEAFFDGFVRKVDDNEPGNYGGNASEDAFDDLDLMLGECV